MIQSITEFQALQNAANSLNIEGLIIHERQPNDKRNTVKKYFLQHGGRTISPNLDYDQMNHFILGMNQMKGIYSHN